jgi:hypothetical protein
MTADDGSQFHLCDVIDKFDSDVEQGELNKRGWVLQERALSRRTMHFTETQTYWECGEGVWCETFTKTKKYVEFLSEIFFSVASLLTPVIAGKHLSSATLTFLILSMPIRKV